MKVSRAWLNTFFNTELPEAEKLSEALTFHVFEIDGIEEKNNDSILDVKVTANRGHDCLGHRAIAKELSAILKLPLVNDPMAKKPSLLPVTEAISLTLEEASLSPRYIAGYIKGVKVGPSPEWLQKSLEAIGQRSINNVVDATNFVMFNIGQPLHAFDAKMLMQKDNKFNIVVRKARVGEKMHALDGKEYTFTDSMLVIVDGNKDEAIGVAGIKGGTAAGITEATTDIILESANFNSVSVRKTAAALKLRTDASARFEQGLSPELAAYGMQSVAQLIQKLAGGELVGFADVYPTPQPPMYAAVSVEKINSILGVTLTGAEVADVFVRLGLPYKEEQGIFSVTVPPERLDLVIPEDLIEEVVRIVGYDKIPATELPALSQKVAININFYAAEHVRASLAAQGYSEVFTSAFADKGERAVLNKVDSVRPHLRANLVDGLKEALEKNKRNKEFLNLKALKLFEIGTVWKDGGEVVMVGTADEKKVEEKPLSDYAKEFSNVTEYEELPVSTTMRYEAFSKYPFIVRDIALWTPAGTMQEDVLGVVRPEAGNLLMRAMLFDRFEKGDKVSLAFRLIFQSFDRTLTEEEVNVVMQKISEALKAKGFEIR